MASPGPGATRAVRMEAQQLRPAALALDGAAPELESVAGSAGRLAAYGGVHLLPAAGGSRHNGAAGLVEAPDAPKWGAR